MLATATTTSVDFSGVSLPFSVTDLLNSSMGLLSLFSTFILLGLAIFFAPKLFSLFRKAIGAGGKA